MPPTIKRSSRKTFEPPWDASVVLTHARMLQHAFVAAQTKPLLRGRNFGLLSDASDGPGAALFRSAVVEMGGHVAHLRPSQLTLGTPQEVHQTARMLGRLYAAVECQGVSPVLLHQVAVDGAVAVFDFLASGHHPTARLAEQLSGNASPGDNRRFVLQAVLLSTVP